MRQLLVDLGEGVLPSAGGSWPVYASQEPSTPDNAITVYGTAGLLRGRHGNDGEVQEAYGIQVRVRGVDHDTGWDKADGLAQALDKSVRLDIVTISGTQYTVYSANRRGTILNLGRDPETSRRLFTINYVVTISQN